MEQKLSLGERFWKIITFKGLAKVKYGLCFRFFGFATYICSPKGNGGVAQVVRALDS